MIGDTLQHYKIVKQLGRGGMGEVYWTDRNWRRWSPDGKEISYMVEENGVENIWPQPLDGADPHRVTDFDSGTIGANWPPSPDGTCMVVNRGSESTDVVLLRVQ